MWDFIVQAWNTLIFEPIFNFMAFLIAVVPWHNFGVALIIFTVVTRLLLYPIIKQQLAAIKKQKELQPEVAKIRKANKGNRQQEALEIMALYKRNNFNPFASLLYILIQVPIFVGLYQTITRIAGDPQALAEGPHVYGFIQGLDWIKNLAADPSIFDPTFAGLVDLTRPAIGEQGLYAAALVIVVLTTAVQYLTSRQMALSGSGGEQKTLRAIMKEQKDGVEVDKAEINAAMSRLFIYVLPVIIFFFSLGWYAALPFWWLINGIMQFFQQRLIEKKGQGEAVKANVNGQDIEAEVTKPLNAKQKRMQAASPRRPTTRGGPKRVSATARTVNKKKQRG